MGAAVWEVRCQTLHTQHTHTHTHVIDARAGQQTNHSTDTTRSHDTHATTQHIQPHSLTHRHVNHSTGTGTRCTQEHERSHLIHPILPSVDRPLVPVALSVQLLSRARLVWLIRCSQPCLCRLRRRTMPPRAPRCRPAIRAMQAAPPLPIPPRRLAGPPTTATSETGRRRASESASTRPASVSTLNCTRKHTHTYTYTVISRGRHRSCQCVRRVEAASVPQCIAGPAASRFHHTSPPPRAADLSCRCCISSVLLLAAVVSAACRV